MNLTTGVRERLRTALPLEDLLPDHMPAFMRSPAYFFGMISLSSLVFLILSGIITSPNVDALVIVTMGILTTLLVVFPYLPYVNRLPYYLGVHRLIWREYYRDVRNVHKVHMVEGVSAGPAT